MWQRQLNKEHEGDHPCRTDTTLRPREPGFEHECEEAVLLLGLQAGFIWEISRLSGEVNAISADFLNALKVTHGEVRGNQFLDDIGRYW